MWQSVKPLFLSLYLLLNLPIVFLSGFILKKKKSNFYLIISNNPISVERIFFFLFIESTWIFFLSPPTTTIIAPPTTLIIMQFNCSTHSIWIDYRNILFSVYYYYYYYSSFWNSYSWSRWFRFTLTTKKNDDFLMKFNHKWIENFPGKFLLDVKKNLESQKKNFLQH